MALEDFEELKICEFLNLQSLGWKAPLLTANFGEGFGAGALAGLASGLHRWNLAASVLPDLDDYSIDYELDGDDYTDPRFTYLFEFIKRHIGLNNKPFVIKDPRTGRKFLASFDTNDFEFTAITALIFEGGINLVQRRAEGLSFNSDGSLDLDYTPPTISLSIDGTSPYSGLRTLTATVSDNVAVVRVDFYCGLDLLGSAMSSPWEFDFDTFAYDGTRTLKAVAYDLAGNLAKTSLSIEIEQYILIDADGSHLIDSDEETLYEG